MNTELREKSWEELAVRWGRQLSELQRAMARGFPTVWDTPPGFDRPSDIVEAIALHKMTRKGDMTEMERGTEVLWHLETAIRIAHQSEVTNRVSLSIDHAKDLAAEIRRLAAELESVREALGGYQDSNLASLATTLQRRNEALTAEIERKDVALRAVSRELRHWIGHADGKAMHPQREKGDNALRLADRALTRKGETDGYGADHRELESLLPVEVHGHLLVRRGSWKARCLECERVGPDEAAWWEQFECTATPEPEDEG